MFGIGFPYLTSAFSLIHLVFLETVKIQVGPRRTQSVSFVARIVVAHFAILIFSDTVVALEASTEKHLIVCQS